MFLLALCFGALMRAAGSSMSLSSRAEGYTQASLWASGLLDRTFVSEFPDEGPHEGEFDDTYHWKMRVSLLPENAMPTYGALRIYKIDLTVEWKAGGQPASAHFVTMRTVATPQPVTSQISSTGDS